MHISKTRNCLVVATALLLAACGKQERLEAVRFAKLLAEQQANFAAADAIEKDIVTNARAWCGAITGHGAGRGEELDQNAAVAAELAKSAIAASAHLSEIRQAIDTYSLQEEYPRSIRNALTTQLTRRQRMLQDFRVLLENSAEQFRQYRQSKSFAGDTYADGIAKLDALLASYKPWPRTLLEVRCPPWDRNTNSGITRSLTRTPVQRQEHCFVLSEHSFVVLSRRRQSCHIPKPYPVYLDRRTDMIKWVLRRAIDKFERDWDYDASYMRDMIDASPRAAWLFSRVTALGQFRRDLPIEAWCAAGITAVRHEDCGPCTQLAVTMAERAGVSPEVLRAVLANNPDAMPPDVALVWKFTRATLAHDPAADEYRDAILRRWGRRALVSLAFAITAARVYPTVKYALGHGKACMRVVVGGTPVTFDHGRGPAPADVAVRTP